MTVCLIDYEQHHDMCDVLTVISNARQYFPTRDVITARLGIQGDAQGGVLLTLLHKHTLVALGDSKRQELCLHLIQMVCVSVCVSSKWCVCMCVCVSHPNGVCVG